MISKPGSRCFHQAKFKLRGHDHLLSSNEVIQFHHAVQLVPLTCQKLFELPFNKGSVGITVKEPFMAGLSKELA